MFVRLGIPVIALSLLALAIVSVLRTRSVDAYVPPPVPPPAASFERSVAGTGLVEASSENVEIAAPVSALVLAVHVRPGAHVAKGDPLFQLDDRPLIAERAVGEAAVAAAQARLDRLRALPRPEDLPPALARVRRWEAALAGARTQHGRYERAERDGAARAELVTLHRTDLETARAQLDEARAALAQLQAGAWAHDLAASRSELAAEVARLEQVRVQLARLTVRAPIAGEVLQVKVRAGEFAPAGRLAQPLMLLGATDQLHLRIAVDEHDAGRVTPAARAVAQVRGDPAKRLPLRFVRVEPYVLPKTALTNQVAERVDTRVLEAVYALPAGERSVQVGRLMDVFIESPEDAAPTRRPHQ